ncbi:MAG: hypothetical protein QOG68_1921, partial [Solirubrobacteraceae bacterium]|nr:hypothetical protein [Solirubrobacteraceae bacterium]
FTQTAQALDALGYRYELDAYQPCANAMCSPLFPNHLELAINDQFAPAAAFLDDATVDRNPSHVTYVREPSRDHPELQLVADHAYWVSALKLRDATSRGQIDAISHGAGGGEPVSTPLPSGTGTLTGGNMGALTFVRSGRTWTTTPGPVADRLEITATNLSAATIDVKRASLTCNAKVDITSDGPIDVTLAGCNRVVKGGT